MNKDIRFKKLDNIVNDDYISKIGDIADNVRDITIEARVDKYKIFELKKSILVILHLEDKTGKICAILGGNRDDEDFKKIVSHIGINAHYRIRGSVSSFEEDNEEEYDDMFTTIKEYFIGDKLLTIRGIQNIDKYYNEYEKVKLFGVDIHTLYCLDLKDAYEFVNKNTDYLTNISIDEVKEIKFSYYKDIIILLKNGKVLFNGEERLDNIKTLGIDGGMYVFSFSNDNVITCLTGTWKTTEFINNNNYKYKKIVMVGLGIAALTYENTIRFFGMIVDSVIDYTNFYDVEDIGYIEEENDIGIIKNGQIISLFGNEEYSDILLKGSGEDFMIIDKE